MDNVTLTSPSQSQASTGYQWTVEELITDSFALHDLLRRETRALRNFDMAQVKNLHEEKLRLIRKLELHKELISRHPQLMQAATDDQKKRLKIASFSMEAVARDNFCETLKAREINSCVVRAVSRELRNNEQVNNGYTRRGKLADEATSQRQHTPTTAVAVNQMI